MMRDTEDFSALARMDSKLYKDLVGLPYESKAEGPHAYDCFGVIKEVYRRCGINLPDALCTDEWEDIDRVIGESRSKYRRIDKPEVGCIVAFRTIGKLVTHVGLVIDHCRMLHSSEKTDVCISRFDTKLWRQKVEGYYVIN